MSEAAGGPAAATHGYQLALRVAGLILILGVVVGAVLAVRARNVGRLSQEPERPASEEEVV